MRTHFSKLGNVPQDVLASGNLTESQTPSVLRKISSESKKAEDLHREALIDLQITQSLLEQEDDVSKKVKGYVQSLSLSPFWEASPWPLVDWSWKCTARRRVVAVGMWPRKSTPRWRTMTTMRRMPCLCVPCHRKKNWMPICSKYEPHKPKHPNSMYTNNNITILIESGNITALQIFEIDEAII